VKKGFNQCAFAEVIAKLKLGYHFFGPPDAIVILANMLSVISIYLTNLQNINTVSICGQYYIDVVSKLKS